LLMGRILAHAVLRLAFVDAKDWTTSVTPRVVRK
jgi:hypothetical protein